jgi:threonine synthase
VRAFLAGKQFAEPWADATTEAAGLRVPSSVGDFLILDAINASGGTAIAVPESVLASTQAFAASHGVGFLSLETAAVFASLPELRSRGVIGPDDTVVAFDTGAGFKSTLPEVPPQRTVSANDADWEALLSSYPPA